MFEDLKPAIAQENYNTATELTNNLKQQYRYHPWLQFYTARVQEAKGNYPTAQTIYQQILQNDNHPKASIKLAKASVALNKLMPKNTANLPLQPLRVKMGQRHQKF